MGSMAHPYFLRVAYDGTDFHGWQIQSVLPTVQGALGLALGAFDPAAPPPQGTGRTDAGVHAEAQGVLVRATRVWDPHRLLTALNAHLPATIRVMTAEVAPEGFLPRRDAVAKRYRYRLGEGPAAFPLDRAFRWHLFGKAPLDREAMAEAAAHWVGTHDFSSFRNRECVAEGPVRTLHALRLEAHPRGLDLVFEGNAFLMHQVRIMSGTLVQVGQGKLRAAQALEILVARRREAAGETAPPQGLCMERVWYAAKWGIGERSPWPE